MVDLKDSQSANMLENYLEAQKEVQ
jgi:hypothetical protein